MRMVTDPDELTDYEKGFISGWLAAQGIFKEPTEEQVREALMRLVAFQSPTSSARH